ncbi:MAG: MFS transporter [Candidatus Promineifilaceae bacterium]|jgi:MFS transporter, FSR family, fosmidomycin resistance protein
MAAAEANYLQRKDYRAVAYAHFMVDMLNSSRALLVAILAVLLGLSNTQVAIILLLYNVGNALSQPLFGRLADRIGPRWPVVGGVAWMVVFYAISALAPPYLALAALTVAGLGSGAFHPTGTMVASEASEKHRTQATSVFFMAGQLGLFVGPVAAGVLLEQFGRSGYIVLPALAFSALVGAWHWLKTKPAAAERPPGHSETAVARAALPDQLYRRAILIAIVILCVGTISQAAITFAPKLFTELGYSASYVGLVAGIFMLGSAVGGVTGGVLADRWNGRITILLATSAALIPTFYYVNAPDFARLLLMILTGFFIGMPHSILVLMVQQLLPGQRAMASGLALGFMFFSGSLGVLAVGFIADQIGLAQALQLTAFLTIVAFAATLLLPKASVHYSLNSVR